MLILKCIKGAIEGAAYGLFLSCLFIPIIAMTIIFTIGDGKALKMTPFLMGILIPACMILGVISPIRKAKIATRQAAAHQAAIKAAALQAAHEAELARSKRHREEQQKYHKELMVVAEHSMHLLEAMPTWLGSAEDCLNQAEINFADSAFSPFWDSIENSAKWLANFDESVHKITDNLSRYTELTKEYEEIPPPFPLSNLSIEKLRIGTETAKRMQAIVRKAQRDFQFSMIYEQRKTNKILTAGFTNLAEALRDMVTQVTDSIDYLAISLDGMASTLNETLSAIHSRVDDVAATVSRYVDAASNVASETAAHEQKVQEMLDNIQRGRRPFP